MSQLKMDLATIKRPGSGSSEPIYNILSGAM
jgi:hypothetical protein